MFDTTTQKTPAELKAIEILNTINAAEASLIAGLTVIHNAVWNSTLAPEDIFAALGNEGGSVLALGAFTRQFILDSYDACGLSAPDLSAVTPPLETQVDANGVVTVIYPPVAPVEEPVIDVPVGG